MGGRAVEKKNHIMRQFPSTGTAHRTRMRCDPRKDHRPIICQKSISISQFITLSELLTFVRFDQEQSAFVIAPLSVSS